MKNISIHQLEKRLEAVEKASNGELKLKINGIEYKVHSADARSKKNEEKLYVIELKTVNYDNMQKIVYGLVGIILVALASGIVSLLLK